MNGALNALASDTHKRSVEIRDLGPVDYAFAYDLQLQIVARQKADRSSRESLILVEHPDVYTYGRKSKVPPLVAGAQVVEVERGGEVTFHNPGQLVCYPILTLENAERDLHLHLRRLETTLIGVLSEFDIAGERKPGATGVWVQGKGKKIASIGVAVTSWITFHGSALNIHNDLRGFSRISPCGFSADVMTSVTEQLGAATPTMSEVKAAFVHHFAQQFDRQLL